MPNDNIFMCTAVYHDNWDLSVARANSSNSNLFWINANNDETYEAVLSHRGLGTPSLKKIPNQPNNRI
jgi:flagellar motor protein MotB